jgi:hypothetical protein
MKAAEIQEIPVGRLLEYVLPNVSQATGFFLKQPT